MPNPTKGKLRLVVRNFLCTSGIVACILFGAIGTVALLTSLWTILLAPLWMGLAITIGCKLQDIMLEG